jgi:hypothetical protein
MRKAQYDRIVYLIMIVLVLILGLLIINHVGDAAIDAIEGM